MNIIFELKSRKGGARKVEVDKIGQSCWVDYPKNTKIGKKIECEKVLECDEEFGQPYLKNKRVIVEVIGNKVNKKIVVAKYKPKKRYKIKKGHRQQKYLIKVIGVENTN
jgi:large subunit ribosomal protein L21